MSTIVTCSGSSAPRVAPVRLIATSLSPARALTLPAVPITRPQQRAIDTCKLAGLGDQAEVRDDLHEWEYGDYEGITTAQIHETEPDWSLWRDGGPNGEQAADVGARADRLIAEARATEGD